MQSVQFIFLSRKWAVDEKQIKDSLSYFMETDYPIQLLFFPEGTDLSPSNREKSHRYANENGLQKYDYVLHPRTKGFSLCLQELRKGKIPPTVVNISVGYIGTMPQNESDISGGNWPTEIHFFAEQVASVDIPEDEKSIAQWLGKCWEKKESQLKKFYKNNKFSSKYLSEAAMKEKFKDMKKVLFTWLIIILYLSYSFMTNSFYWKYYPLVITFYLVLNHIFTNGIDQLMLKRYRLFSK